METAPLPTTLNVLNCEPPPDLRFTPPVPQSIQSVAPSVARFTAAEEVVTLPDKDPTAIAMLVKVKLAGVATPGADAVTV